MTHPEVRHRELAWKMLDDGVCAVSSSTVYRVLRESNLVCRWKPKERRQGTDRPPPPTKPDQLWQTDIRYTKVRERNYYLLSFVDAYSRYVVHHELLTTMDGLSVSVGAAAAIETLPQEVRPTIQSDHGSGFIAREFAGTLAESGVGHTLIRPHTPTDNGIIERYHRTIGEKIEEHELEDFTQAKAVIVGIIDHYNYRRLHSSLSYLRPVDYYRGDPTTLLAEPPPEITTGQRTAQAGEPETATTTHPLAAGRTPLLGEAGCLTLIETNRLVGEEDRPRANPVSGEGLGGRAPPLDPERCERSRREK